MMKIIGLNDLSTLSTKHKTIIVVAALQIVFGIFTLICNKEIFNKLLQEVIFELSLDQFKLYLSKATGSKGGDKNF